MPETGPTQGQPIAYVLLTLTGLLSGIILAYAFGLAGELLDDEALNPAIVYATQAAFALLVWLPIAWCVLRREARSLAEMGALPATIRPARAAWILALVTIAIAAFLHFGTEGEWANRRGPSSGHTLLFLASFPLLAWFAVRSSLGGKPLVTDEPRAPAAAATDTPMYAPREPSGTLPPEGEARERVLAMLTALDGVDDRFASAFGRERNESAARQLALSAETARIALNAHWGDPLPPGVAMSLAWNLATSATAYSDATRLLEIPAGEAGHDARERIATKYRDKGTFGPGDLGLVLEVARKCRDNAAVDAGMERRTWRALRTP